MKIILSHQSALEFWLSGNMLGSFSTSLSKRSMSVLPPSFCAAVSASEAEDLKARYSLSLPLHSLVSDVNCANSRSGILSTHTWPAMAHSDVFYRLSPDVYVCSPELAFLQASSFMSVCQLVRLGYDLCGTYRVRGGVAEYQVEPLATTLGLQRVVDAYCGKRGVKKARRALAYVRDGAASPRETATALLVGLPYKYGGASFGMPLMNYPISLQDEAARLAGKRTCICDLYFPEWRLDLEYESYEHHSGAAKMEQDSLRRDALGLMGVSVVTVTNKQIVDQDKLNALIHLVSKITGKRFRPQCPDYYLRQRQLQDMLCR